MSCFCPAHPRFLLFLYFVLCQLTGLAAQRPYTVEHLGTSEGLPSLRIRAIAQDQQGMMWFAAFGIGLIRFDGWNYTVFHAGPSSHPRLNSNLLLDIVLDKRGLLWLTNENGIEVLDPVSLQIRPVHLPFVSVSELNYVYSLYVDPSGDIWASTFRGGLLRFLAGDPQKVVLVDSSSTIRYINRATDGHLWYFRDHYPKLMRQDNEGFRPGRYPADGDQIEEIIPVENSDGLLTGLLGLMHQNRKKYYRLDPATGRFVPGIDSAAITRFDVADFIRKSPLKAAAYGNFSSLIDKYLKVFKDKQGLIWISTMDQGIFKLKPQELIFTTCPELKGISLRGMLEDTGGNIYIGSYQGIYRFSPASNHARLLAGNWSAAFHLAACQSDTLLVFMDGGGLRFFNRRTAKLSAFNPVPALTGDESYYSSLRYPDGSLLAGNRHLFRLQPRDWTVQEIGVLPTTAPVRTFIFRRTCDGQTWIGTNQGVFTLSAQGVCDTPALRRDYRLSWQSQVNDIFEDGSGKLWFATRQYGLLRYDPAIFQFKTFDLNNGFSSNEIYSIIGSHDGKMLWVSTSAGIHLIRLQDESIRIFNELDGTGNSEFNTGSYLQSRSGDIYFGGITGLTRFHPESLQLKNGGPALPFIYAVDIEDRSTGSVISLNYPRRDTLFYLSPQQRNLEFKFGTSDYFRSISNTFYVQLSGLDRDWVPLGAVPHIRYYSLPAGRYTFRVKCSKNAVRTGPEIYAVSFEIEEVFYRKWWFTALLAGLVLLLIWLAFRVRLYQIKREQELRHRIANDLHDNMGGSLSSISNLVSVIDRLKRSGKPFDTELQRLLDLTRTAHSAMSDIIWAIDTSQRELTDLTRRMEDFADKWVRAAGTKVVFETVFKGTKRKIPFYLKHQLLLAYKEILGNALKHTFPEQMLIRFETGAENSIQIFVQNSFTERKTDVPSGGRGLSGIEERMARLGGTMKVEEAEQVFRVWIRLGRR